MEHTRSTDWKTHSIRLARALLEVDRTFGPSPTGGLVVPLRTGGAMVYGVTGCVSGSVTVIRRV